MAKSSKELVSRAMKCKTLEELLALAKAEGVALTPEDAKLFLEDVNSFLDDDALEKVAGGYGSIYCGTYTRGKMYEVLFSNK